MKIGIAGLGLIGKQLVATLRDRKPAGKPCSRQYHHPVRGILLKLGSGVCFSALAACVRALGKDVPIGETLFVRGLLSTIVFAAMAWHMQGLQLLKPRNWRSHALRSLAGTSAMGSWFMALTLMPITDVAAIQFTEPLFITLLAIPMLGERIHRYRWTALALGFCGVLIVISPHLSVDTGNSAGVLWALAAAVLGALSMIFLRGMSGTEHALTITFYFSLVTMVCAAFTVLWGWTLPSAAQWRLILLASILGVAAQFLLTFAHRYAEASTLAPLEYATIISATLFGYAFFQELPSIFVWLGTPIVVTAGLMILWREYRLRKSIATQFAKEEPP